MIKTGEFVTSTYWWGCVHKFPVGGTAPYGNLNWETSSDETSTPDLVRCHPPIDDCQTDD